ncbi:hypothetical protein [Neolewinella aurantiaca]|uniref:hypothetical protein n=1 Tax=Neolewinella aurantiaca TaxID=2602767 RepID=UPI00164F24A0|nr:hypothetical protein [Neolewinella aurantiaca]
MINSTNDLKKGLSIIELEDRLEMVQLAAADAAFTRRCDREGCPEETVSPE